MNIQSFKKGDIITRSEPWKHKIQSLGLFGSCETVEDGSFMGNKLTFVGVEAGIIFLLREKDILKLDIRMSEGWDYYPQAMEDEAEKMKQT